MIQGEFPRPLDVSVRFWDRYSLADLVRIGLPSALGWVVAQGAGVLAGALVGLALVELTWRGQTLDEHLLGGLRASLNPTTVQSPAVAHRPPKAAILDDGTVLGLVEIASCPLEARSEAEQRANCDVVTELFADADYPVELQSRQRPIPVDLPGAATEEPIVTDQYLVVRASPRANWLPDGVETVEDRYTAAVNRCEAARTILTGADLDATHLTADALYTALDRLPTGDAKLSLGHYTVEDAPTPIRRVVAVTAYPEQVPAGWLADILNVDTPGLVDVVQTVTPVSDQQRDWLDRMLARAEAERQATRRPTRAATLRQQHRDLEDLTDLDARGEQLVNYGVYIVSRGDSRAEADATLDAVTSKLRQYRIETRAPGWRHHHAITAVDPMQRDQFAERQLVPGWAAATGFPFAAYDTVEAGGVLVGRDRRSDMPVIIDRFAWEAGHLAVLGKTGSGKSYWTGLMLLRAVRRYTTLDIYILDPKRRDYGPLTEALAGETVILDETDLATVEPGWVTRYTVADPTRDNTAQLVDAVRHIYRDAATTDRPTLVVIDETNRILTQGERVHEAGLQAVSKLVRESRDRNIAVTLVSQTANEFIRTNEGRNILKNMTGTLFFKHQRVTGELREFYDLDDADAVALRKLRTGTDVPFSQALIRGPLTTTLEIEATDDEHRLLENGVPDGGSVTPAHAAEPAPTTTSPADDHAADSDPAARQSAPDPPTDSEAHSHPPSEAQEGTRLGLLGSIAAVSRACIKGFEHLVLFGIIIGTALVHAGVIETIRPWRSITLLGVLPKAPTPLEFLFGGVVVSVVVEFVWIVLLGSAAWLMGVKPS